MQINTAASMRFDERVNFCWSDSLHFQHSKIGGYIYLQGQWDKIHLAI